MSDRPILFSGPMIRPILDGRKTQTRRVISSDHHPAPVEHRDGTWRDCCGRELRVLFSVGDRLWVREAWQTWLQYDDVPPRGLTENTAIHHVAGPDAPVNRQMSDSKVRPSIFMPRWASRLTLIVIDVRVQRVQEITASDVEAEGALDYLGHPGCGPSVNCYGPDCPTDPARSCNAHGCWGIREDFAALWDSLNGPRGYGWDANPWVAAYTFTVHRQNIDQMEADAA
ncbi:hypothetical protein [Tranquillimonas rosea]|uniref:hypothetical protein n=1 Tax=Tranquillimonas rosea TaxID=641238 RepID=UPI003BAC121C